MEDLGEDADEVAHKDDDTSNIEEVSCSIWTRVTRISVSMSNSNHLEVWTHLSCGTGIAVALAEDLGALDGGLESETKNVHST